ncbi:MAG: 3-phosphoglycerate dehydrogenase [Acholeplasmataceae bacterium]
MRHIHCLNNISNVGLQALPNTYQLTDDINQADAILVRSAQMHDMILPDSVLAVARAGAGVNNIPLADYAKTGVVVFNTPGANANAVKELTLAGMLLASRDIYGGISWIKENQSDENIAKSIEKVKSQFGGTEIFGKTIGIVGLGAIGILIAQACDALGLKVVGYSLPEPLKAVMHLLPKNIVLVDHIEALFEASDFISLNVPLLAETKHTVNKQTIELMKDGVIILNFARDALVNDDDIEAALKSGKVRHYVTDFPNSRTAQMQGVIAIPHLGASTEEAEDNCAQMAAMQVKAYIETGTIKNAVNYGDLEADDLNGKGRFAIHYMVDDLKVSELKKSIENKMTILSFKTSQKNQFGYALIDTKEQADQASIDQLRHHKGIIRVRKIA